MGRSGCALWQWLSTFVGATAVRRVQTWENEGTVLDPEQACVPWPRVSPA